jgi:hypothetical protein
MQSRGQEGRAAPPGPPELAPLSRTPSPPLSSAAPRPYSRTRGASASLSAAGGALISTPLCCLVLYGESPMEDKREPHRGGPNRATWPSVLTENP